MRLIVGWNATGAMLDRILAAGCVQCERLRIEDGRARLMRWKVGIDAAGIEIWQRRVVCIGCHARLGKPMKADDHPRWREYPIYDDIYERLTDDVSMGRVAPEPSAILPEEFAELKPIALTELLVEIQRAPCLKRVRRAEHLTVGYGINETDVAELSRVLPDGEYAALEFRDSGARLLRFEREHIKVLTPRRAGARLDLSDVSILRIKRSESSP